MGNPNQSLKRSLSLPMCTSLVIGATIGAGIFTTTGTGVTLVGKALPLVFILASFFVMFTNLPSIYQSGALPATGGSYMYVSRFVHPLAGYVHIVSSTIGMLNIAVMGITFATYLSQLFPAVAAKPVIVIGSISIILALGIAHTFGTTIASKVQYIMVGLMIVAIGVYIIPGMLTVSPEYITFREALIPSTVKLSSIWTGLALLRYSVNGGGIIFTLGDEVKNPGRTIPTAFFLGTLITGTVYALVGYVTVGVLPLEQVAGQPLTVAAEHILGNSPWLTFFIVGGALIATVNTLYSSYMIYSRTHFAAARDGIWPEFLSRTNKHKAPYVTIWVCATVGVVAALFFRNSLSDLLMFVSVPGLSMAFIYYIPPMLIKHKLPNCHKRAWFKLPYPVLVAVCVISSVLTFYLGMSLFSRLQPKHWIGMVAIYMLGGIYYYFRFNWLKKNRNMDLFANMRGMHPYWLETENRLETVQKGSGSI